jgi:hypothetical protein
MVAKRVKVYWVLLLKCFAFAFKDGIAAGRVNLLLKKSEYIIQEPKRFLSFPKGKVKDTY